jgi:arylsulfatase
MSLSAEPRPSTGRSSARPNILVIVADDMGFSDPGCYGGEIKTPNIDRLARNGIRFTQAYSTARCWPSRTCLLTGYYAQQVRMDPPKGPLPPWARVLPHYLKPAGYRCYHSGKWHLMGAPKPVADGGFDRSYVLHDHDRFFNPRNHELDDQPLEPVKPGSGFYITTHIADRALEFLDEHQARHASDPFCLYLAFTCPHFPLHALAEDIARYRELYLQGWDRIREQRWRRMRRMGLVNCPLPPPDPDIVPSWNLSAADLERMIGPGEAARAVPWDSLTDEQRRFQATKMAIHAAMVDRMDREIGRVLGRLRSMGSMDDTVILFVSDNGASAEQIIRGDMHDKNAEPGSAGSYLCLGPGWSTASNTPFRLHKSWVHEGGIASPLIVHWPAGIRARNELRHGVCHFIDILPTLMELAGATFEPYWNGRTAPPLPGISLTPAFACDDPLERELLYFHHIGNRAIRMGDWKLVAAADEPWELYDLSRDRSEMRNLAERYPVRVARMAARWEQCEEAWRRQAE